MQICPWASDVAAVKYESSVKYVPGYLNFYISLYFLPFFYLVSRVVSELGVHKKRKGCFARVVGQNLGACSFCSEKRGINPAGGFILSLSHFISNIVFLDSSTGEMNICAFRGAL